MSSPAEREPPGVVVVGIGNEFRNDDGAGLAVVRNLGSRNLRAVRIVELKDDLTRLLDELEQTDIAIVVDAARSGAAPGTIHRIETTNYKLPPESLSHSTHNLSLRDVLELAALQGVAPHTVVLYGIEGISFGYGQSMTPEVVDAVESVADRIAVEIEGRTPMK